MLITYSFVSAQANFESDYRTPTLTDHTVSDIRHTFSAKSECPGPARFLVKRASVVECCSAGRLSQVPVPIQLDGCLSCLSGAAVAGA